MTCESCMRADATQVVHYEADGRFDAATFVVCDDCAPVPYLLPGRA